MAAQNLNQNYGARIMMLCKCTFKGVLTFTIIVTRILAPNFGFNFELPSSGQEMNFLMKQFEFWRHDSTINCATIMVNVSTPLVLPSSDRSPGGSTK